MNSAAYHPPTYSTLEEERLLNLSKFASLLGFHECPSSTSSLTSSIASQTIVSARASSTSASLSARELIAQKVSKGSNGSSGYPTTQKALATEMGKYLFYDNTDALGGSIIKVPAMELESPDDSAHTGAASLMPNIGSSHVSTRTDFNLSPDGRTNSEQPLDAESSAKPAMVASVLHMVSKAEGPKEQIAKDTAKPPNVEPYFDRLQIPSDPSEQNGGDQAPTKQYIGSLASTSTEKSTKIEMVAAVNMSRPLSFTRSSAQHAPSALIRSLFSSFSSLVESRVRTWTLLLLRHSLSSGDKNSRDRLMSLLSTQNAFEMNAMITDFQVKDILPEIKAALFRHGHDGSEKRRLAQMEGNSGLEMKYCDLAIPVNFIVSIDVTVQSHKVTVNLSAPATVGAIFATNSSLIRYAETSINTDMLVSSMVEQARLVVFQAVARATSSTKEVMEKLNPKQSNGGNDISALSLGSIDAPANKRPSVVGNVGRHLLQKNTSSVIPEHQAATHENGAAASIQNQHGSANFSSLLKCPGSFTRRPRDMGIARNRSVQWDTNFKKKTFQVEEHADCSGQKRLRKPTLSGPVLKRSTKSFGKPDAEIFESSRNATFAEFGNIAKSPHMLARSNASSNSSAYHVSTHLLQRNRTFGNITSDSLSSSGSKANAMFELNRPRPSFGGMHGLQAGNVSKPSPSLLEGVRRPSFQELSRNAKYSVTPPNASTSILGLHGMTNGEFKRTPTLLETMLLSTQTRRNSLSEDKDAWKGNATF